MRSPIKKLQHQLQNEASDGNDCTGNQKIGPRPLLLPADHSFADGEYRNRRIGGINRQQVGLHLLDQPNHNGKAGNGCGDFVGEGHVFPVHCFFLSRM